MQILYKSYLFWGYGITGFLLAIQFVMVWFEWHRVAKKHHA